MPGGETGEIYLRSPHIARGYLDEPVLTSERFIVNPFTGAAGDRLYRTGDLGRYTPNGEVEPLGRADQQVKIRGFRVELGEIEAVIGSHAGVREAPRDHPEEAHAAAPGSPPERREGCGGGPSTSTRGNEALTRSSWVTTSWSP